jgi:hypothetical protein
MPRQVEMKRASIVLLSLTLLACSKPGKVSVDEHLKTSRARVGAVASPGAGPAATTTSASESEYEATVVARFTGGQLTAADVRQWIAHLNEVDRIRYQSADTKRELVSEIVSMELLAREAIEQGYAEREEFRALLKMEVARRFLEDRVRQSVSLKDITDADVDAYYGAHRAEFIRGETRLVSRIVVGSAPLAAQVRADIDAAIAAQATPGSEGEPIAAAKLVFGKALRRYTEEVHGRRDRGVVGWIDARGIVRGIVERKQVCAAVARAAFALPAEGGLAGPIPCAEEHTVILVDGRRPPVQLSRDEVASRIKNRLLQERKEAAKRDIIKSLVAKAEIRIHDERLLEVAPPATPRTKPVEPAKPRFRPPSLLKHGMSARGMKPIRAEASRSFERLDAETKKGLIEEQAEKALK